MTGEGERELAGAVPGEHTGRPKVRCHLKPLGGETNFTVRFRRGDREQERGTEMEGQWRERGGAGAGEETDRRRRVGQSRTGRRDRKVGGRLDWVRQGWARETVTGMEGETRGLGQVGSRRTRTQKERKEPNGSY